MSSTSAVAVLAQGLRDLRDFAESPDTAELSRRTGLTEQQIDAALAGEELPTREVTLALVTAWEGDVEAWRDYWAQIAELVRDDGAEPEGAGAERVPVAPEPSIITPLPAQDPEAAHTTEEAEDPPAQAETSQAPEATESEEATEPVAAGEPVEAAEPVDVVEPARLVESAEPEPKPEAEADPNPPTKRLLARAGIPALVFVVGVAVGAFGDHALRSKSASDSTAASLPPASQSHSSQPSSAATGATTPTRGVSTSSAAVPAGNSSSESADSSGSGSSSSSTSASSSASSSQPTDSDSSNPPGTTLGTYTGIQLASGYSIDFFHDPYHPVSGTSNGPDSMGFFATSFVDGTFYADRAAILDPQETGSYAVCVNDTRYQKDVPLSKVSASSAFCIHTSTGHLVLVTVRRMPSSTDTNPYAVVDLTVWQN